jgi:hypothetical protein
VDGGLVGSAERRAEGAHPLGIARR